MISQTHLDRAGACRWDPNFVKLPAPELVELIDGIIACARGGVQLTEAERESLKPFCAAADAHATTRGPVVLRSEDYYHLVELGKRVEAELAACGQTGTTPGPYVFLEEPPEAATPAADPPPQEPPAMPAATPKLAASAEPPPKPKRRRRTPSADKTDDHAP